MNEEIKENIQKIFAEKSAVIAQEHIPAMTETMMKVFELGFYAGYEAGCMQFVGKPMSELIND